MVRLFSKRQKPSGSVTFVDEGEVEGAASAFVPDLTGRAEGRRFRAQRRMTGRLWMCAAAFLIVYALMGYRLAQVTLVGDGPAVVQARAVATPSSERPVIVDREGRHLAMNMPVTGLAVNTDEMSGAVRTAEAIASVLDDVDADRLSRRLERLDYVPVRNELSAQERARLVALGLPGVEFPESQKRVYPQRDVAAHLVGYTIPGRGGVAGLEAYVDEVGGPVVSSVNIAAQQIVEQELAAAMADYSAKAAWGIVMDAATGEIVAMASLPDFNPNQPGESPAASRRNRVLHDAYELGSAFKVIFAAAALEDGASDLDRRYDVRQPLTVGDRTIYDYHPRGGFMTMSEVLQYSSNIGMAQIALDHGAVAQRRWVERLGLADSLRTEAPERRAPMLPARWHDVETATISYGHGIAVSPMHLLAAFAPVVNGGTYVTPTLVKTDEGQKRQVFSKRTSAQMRVLLRKIVTDGTGRNAEAEGYYVIGKTATADKPSPRGGYDDDRRLSSFIGAFPGYDPRYVMLVSLDEPEPTEETYGYATAGVVAAPAFRNIVLRIAPVLGIHPVGDDLAFAGFMGDLRDDEVKLAMQNVPTAAVPVRDDAMAAFIESLGP